MSPEKDDPPLGETKGDVVARTLGTLAGGIPGIGQMVQIAINETIPNVRMERIEAYLRYLQERLDDLEVKTALESPERLDIFEEGIGQSARAWTDERRQRIAGLVIRGLRGGDFERLQSRHYLRILNQLGDEDIAVLLDQHRWELDHPKSPDGDEDNEETLERRRNFPEIIVRRRHLLATYGLIAMSSGWGALVIDELTSNGQDFLRYLGVVDDEAR